MSTNDRSGLLLEMKKRRLFLEEDDTGNFDYLLFGNFDGIRLKNANEWYDFAPSIDMDQNAADKGDRKLKDELYITTYILKLIYPQALPPGDFNYELWREGAAVELPKDNAPFFALVMINISKSLAGEYEQSAKLFEFVAKMIEAIDEQKPGALASLNCGLFESLGYYDYVIFVRTGSPDNLVRLLDILKTARCRSGAPAVSASYTVLGIHNWMRRNAAMPAGYAGAFSQSENYLKQVIVNLQLKPGGDITDIIHSLALSREGTVEHDCVNSNWDVSLVIRADQLGALIPEYFKNGGLNPGTPVYNRNVLSKSTMFYFKTVDSQGKKTQAPMTQAPTKIEAEYDAVFRCYKELRDRDHLTQRLTTALRQTVQRYLNLVRSEHAFELDYLLKPVMNSLFKNMERSNKLLMNDSGSGEDTAREREAAWLEYDTALRAFRDLVGGFLADISLSDKYFIEDSQLKHPPIGSATKLIFFYNLLVSELVSSINTNEDTTYSFLVKSGGSDEVSVSNLFNHLPPHRPGETRHSEDCLLVIELPERVLYNIRASVYAILHETFHIVGNRNRQLRYQQTVAAVSDFLAEFLSTLLFNREVLTDQTAGVDEAREGFDSIYKQVVTEFRTEASEYLRENITARTEPSLQAGPRDIALFSRTVFTEINESVTKLLTPDFAGGNKVFNHIYRLYHTKQEQLLSRLSALLSELGKLPVTKIDLLKCRMRYYRQAVDEESDLVVLPENLNSNVTALLWTAFESVTGNSVYIDASVFREIIGIHDRDEVAAYFDNYRVEAIIDCCQNVMNESFSDCMMIRLTLMPVEDYFACICCMTEGSIRKIFPLSEESKLRMGCVLEAAYGIDNRLDEAVKQKIKEKFDKMNDTRVYLKKINGGELSRHVDAMLEECNEAYRDSHVKRNIVDYLKAAVSDAVEEIQNSEKARSAVERIKDIYRKWDAKNTENIPGIILDRWLTLAKDR